MTIAEIQRAVASKERQKKMAEQEQASFDYKLADLIGISVSRIFNQENKFPSIAEVYPMLFENQEQKQKEQDRRDELSAIRFRQFAQSYNQNFRREMGKEIE